MTSDEARGKHGLCETVIIRMGDSQVIINESDFDAAVHTRWDDQDAPVLTLATETADETPEHEATDAASAKAGKKKR